MWKLLMREGGEERRGEVAQGAQTGAQGRRGESERQLRAADRLHVGAAAEAAERAARLGGRRQHPHWARKGLLLLAVTALRCRLHCCRAIAAPPSPNLQAAAAHPAAPWSLPSPPPSTCSAEQVATSLPLCRSHRLPRSN